MEQGEEFENFQIVPNKLVDFKDHTYYISIDDLNGPITQNSCKFVRLREEVDANNSTRNYSLDPFSPFEERVALPKEFWTKREVIKMTFSIHRMTTNCKRAHEKCKLRKYIGILTLFFSYKGLSDIEECFVIKPTVMQLECKKGRGSVFLLFSPISEGSNEHELLLGCFTGYSFPDPKELKQAFSLVMGKAWIAPLWDTPEERERSGSVGSANSSSDEEKENLRKLLLIQSAKKEDDPESLEEKWIQLCF